MQYYTIIYKIRQQQQYCSLCCYMCIYMYYVYIYIRYIQSIYMYCVCIYCIYKVYANIHIYLEYMYPQIYTYICDDYLIRSSHKIVFIQTQQYKCARGTTWSLKSHHSLWSSSSLSMYDAKQTYNNLSRYLLKNIKGNL